MSNSYEDYEREYQSYLSRIRSYLAGTRTRSTLAECDRLLKEAKSCAAKMQGMAEVAGDSFKAQEASQKLTREVAPLAREIEGQLSQLGREELFYQAPDIESDTQRLIQSSDDLLRESQSILMETEQVGNRTLGQMGQQREQLLNANRNLEAVIEVSQQARRILKSIGLRAFKSKLFLYCMIGVLIFANLWVLVKIYKKNHSGGSSKDM